MIKLFKNIRKTNLKEGKMANYFKYAIGEILLVVIGILIALQINNWNENRINNRQEVIILKSLKTEMKENQMLLSSVINNHSEVLKLLKELNSNISPNPNELDDRTLDSLMYGLGWLPHYSPNDGVINSTINSGKITLIKSNELSSKLSSWNSLLNEYTNAYKWTERDVFEQVLPYTKEKYPFKRTLKYFGREIKANSKFEYSKYKLLSDIGFESLVSNRIIDARDILGSAKELYKFQAEILDLIEIELKGK
jgi:Family of unknown function (DUF6090)